MEAYSDYSHASLWNIDDLPTGAPGDAALSHLIEDKEIAARAVAIVIGSARRGVVTLCADVAELLKSKRSLERQVSRLTSENDALRHRCSSSSTPPDLEFRSHSANTSGYHSRPAVVAVSAGEAGSRPASNPALDDLTGTLPVSRLRRRYRSVQLPVTARRTSDSATDELVSLREEVRAALRANAAIVTELMNTKRELNHLRSQSPNADKACPVCRHNTRPSSAPLVRETSTTGAVSLLGCACRQCFLLRRHGCPRRLLQLTTITSNEVVRIKDQVILTDGRSGIVKYIGHVDNDSEKDPHAIWLGIEFNEEVGSGDGKLDHKRYFSCRPKHGEFVLINDVSKVLSQSTVSPAATYVTDFI